MNSKGYTVTTGQKSFYFTFLAFGSLIAISAFINLSGGRVIGIVGPLVFNGLPLFFFARGSQAARKWLAFVSGFYALLIFAFLLSVIFAKAANDGSGGWFVLTMTPFLGAFAYLSSILLFSEPLKQYLGKVAEKHKAKEALQRQALIDDLEGRAEPGSKTKE